MEHGAKHLFRPSARLRAENVYARAPAGGPDYDRARLHPRQGEGRRQRPLLLVDAHRRQVGDAVRHERPPEVDGFPSRTSEWNLELHRTRGT